MEKIRKIIKMKDKKGQGWNVKKLMTMLLVVMVVVVVIISVVKFDMLSFFRDVLPGNFSTGGEDDLLEDAVIAGIPVKILLNDGEGRCVVVESNDAGWEWLKGYGVRGGKLEWFDKSKENWENIDKQVDLSDGEIKSCEIVQKLIADEKKLMRYILEYFQKEYNDCSYVVEYDDPSSTSTSGRDRCLNLKELYTSDLTFDSIVTGDFKLIRKEILELIPLIIRGDSSLNYNSESISLFDSNHYINFDDGELNLEMSIGGLFVFNPQIHLESKDIVLGSTLNSKYVTNGKDIFNFDSSMRLIQIKEDDFPYLFIEGCSKLKKELKNDLMKECYED